MADLENKTVKAKVENKPTAAKTQSISAPKRTESGAKKQIWEKRSAHDSKDLSKKGADRANKVKNRTRFGEANNEFSEKVVNISRVTKVVKGGRRFSFSAFVVVGDKKGKVGFGHGKANEVPDAIKKAVKDARNHLITVPIQNKITVPHEIHAKFLASKVMLKPAPKGKGIVASGTVRAVVELAGYTDIYTKTYGSRSKANIVRATLKALQQLRTPEQIAEIREKNVKDLLD
ncbi:30S ribosomal protein S5 [Mycoplasmopsis bovis 1067]|uniref:30S ribosomal protein S5 n=1 Tax=Mycoplasmopsis bovis TaxID=28903 RepID=UPI0010AE21E1|nr:30S ribosomal protein S5 [Mycoplasmopsis bovis 1067]